MPFEPRSVSEARTVSGEGQEAGLGSLRGCLVEGDAEQRNRERRIRRRALVISVLVQSAVLTLLVLVQLFGKTERISAKDFVPIPPYGHPRHHTSGSTNPRPDRPVNSGSRYQFPSPANRPVPQSNENEGPVGPPNIHRDQDKRLAHLAIGA